MSSAEIERKIKEYGGCHFNSLTNTIHTLYSTSRLLYVNLILYLILSPPWCPAAAIMSCTRAIVPMSSRFRGDEFSHTGSRLSELKHFSSLIECKKLAVLVGNSRILY